MLAELRLVSWNIDGAERVLVPPSTRGTRTRNGQPSLQLRELHERLGEPHILALQELRIRASDAELTARLENALPGYVCGHSLCADPINVRFRGGRAYGVATFVRADLEPRLSRTKLDVHPRLRTEGPHAIARAMLNDDFIPRLEVEDVFRVHNPKARAYTWFNRVAAKHGRVDAARVDYVLVSRSLLPSVVRATIREDQVFVLGSDHAPVMLTVKSSDQ